MIYHYINVIDDYIGVNGDCYTLKTEQVKEILNEFEAKEQLIEELKLQIKHLQKSNYTLKSLLLSKLPSYLNAIVESL